MIDVLVLGVLAIGVAIVIAPPPPETPGNLRSPFELSNQATAMYALGFLYYWFAEWWFAGTAGKYAVGLRIVRADGSRPGAWRAFGRTAFRFVDWLPMLYGTGAIVMLTMANRQRVGDIVAGTYVVRRTQVR